MRLAVVAAVATLLASAPVSGQSPAPVPHPYGLDPFKPSDAALLRQYGSVLVAQTPLLDLRKLDPFTPSHAALLRDLGGAIPLWGLWYPPVPVPFTPLSITDVALKRKSCCVTVVVQGQPASADAAKSAAAVAPLPQLERAITARRPETSDGIWISYAGRTWISAGAAVPFDESLFTHVGEYDGFPVFRQRARADVIYLPARPGVVAPYRLKAR